MRFYREQIQLMSLLIIRKINIDTYRKLSHQFQLSYKKYKVAVIMLDEEICLSQVNVIEKWLCDLQRDDDYQEIVSQLAIFSQIY